MSWKSNFLFDKMKNWEKLCKWVWSTDTNQVDSEESMYHVYAQSNNQYYIGSTVTNTYNTSTNKLNSPEALIFSDTEEQPQETYTQEEVLSALAALGITPQVLASALFGTIDTENSNEQRTVYIYTIDDIFRAYATINGYTYISYTQEID